MSIIGVSLLGDIGIDIVSGLELDLPIWSPPPGDEVYPFGHNHGLKEGGGGAMAYVVLRISSYIRSSEKSRNDAQLLNAECRRIVIEHRKLSALYPGHLLVARSAGQYWFSHIFTEKDRI